MDSPSPFISPEFPLLAKASDGIIIFANYKVKYSVLKRITNLLKKFDVKLIGSIIREENSILEKETCEKKKNKAGCVKKKNQY